MFMAFKLYEKQKLLSAVMMKIITMIMTITSIVIIIVIAIKW